MISTIDEITNERVIQLFNICRLYFAGKYDFVKYNGKSKSYPKMNIRLNAIARKLIQEFKTEEQIQRHYAIILFYDRSCYVDDIAQSVLIERSKTYLQDLTSVNECVRLIDVGGFTQSITEHDGYHAEIFSDLIGKRLSPIVFATIDKLTGMTKSWSTPIWERNKHRTYCLLELLAIPPKVSVSFGKLLRNRLST